MGNTTEIVGNSHRDDSVIVREIIGRGVAARGFVRMQSVCQAKKSPVGRRAAGKNAIRSLFFEEEQAQKVDIQLLRALTVPFVRPACLVTV